MESPPKFLLHLAADLMLEFAGLGDLAAFVQFLGDSSPKDLPSLGHLSSLASDQGSDLPSVCCIRTPQSITQLLRNVKN